MHVATLRSLKIGGRCRLHPAMIRLGLRGRGGIVLPREQDAKSGHRLFASIRLLPNNTLRIAARGRRVTAPDVIGRSLQPIIGRLIPLWSGRVFFHNGLCLNFKDIPD
jgi:hypothetical protein